jgi:putative ATP-dependent endonuclease of OLD family
LGFGHTELAKSDYGFLARFLDVTKANLFFCRGLLIVEGDAENILLPVLAHLLGRDLTEHGVSVVNVGGTGLRRFARIFLRSKPNEDGTVNVPVACVADFDVMPDCAPEIMDQVPVGGEWPKKEARRWRARKDFTSDQLMTRREEIKAKASGQNVTTFVADQWTLEYDLAFAGLMQDVWIAAHLAQNDEKIAAGKCTITTVAVGACKSYAKLAHGGHSQEELACHAYALFKRHSKVSKATAAQYLGCLLEGRSRKGELTPETLRRRLPKYLVEAIEYVTAKGGPPVTPATEARSDG